MLFATTPTSRASQIITAGRPAQLDIRTAGACSIRITLKPFSFEPVFPYHPALAERKYADTDIRLRRIDKPVKKQVGALLVEVQPDPLKIIVTNAEGQDVLLVGRFFH